MDRSSSVLTHPPKTLFFDGLGTKDVREIVAAAKALTLPSDRIVITAGESATQLFLLLSGNAQFYRLSRDGDKVLLARLASGDVFGLGTLLGRRLRYIGTAETISDSELLVWEHARIRKLAHKFPKLAENALSITLHYLAAHTDRLVDLVTLTAPERLAQVVFHLGNQVGRTVPSGIEIEVSNEELAGLANISTFTVSRLLNEWERQKAVAKSRGKLVVQSPETLLDR